MTPEQRALAEEHMALAVSVARATSRNWPTYLDADDILQAAHFGLCQAAAAYDPARGHASFSTFAYRRVRGAVVDWLRSQGIERREQMPEGLEAAQAASADDPAAVAAERERRASLSGSVSRLPEQARRAVAGYYWRGHTLRDMAEPEGVTISAMCRRHRLGLRLLAERDAVRRHLNGP